MRSRKDIILRACATGSLDGVEVGAEHVQIDLDRVRLWAERKVGIPESKASVNLSRSFGVRVESLTQLTTPHPALVQQEVAHHSWSR